MSIPCKHARNTLFTDNTAIDTLIGTLKEVTVALLSTYS